MSNVMTSELHYDGAPRAITADEAKRIAHEEWTLVGPRYGQYRALSRGSDGGMHVRETFSRGQLAVTWVNVRRQDLRERIMGGKCTHTIFYDRARDTFYCG